MKTIQIDDDIYAYLAGNQKLFGESESSVLRRLLKLNTHDNTQLSKKETNLTISESKTRRKPPARLSRLVSAGYLKEGQVLYLYIEDDPIAKGIISGNKLLFKGKKRSMSDIALEHLNEFYDYNYKAARGPSYWFTGTEEDARSISDLWNEYLMSLKY